MRNLIRITVALSLALMAPEMAALEAAELGSLVKDQQIHAFRTETLYEDAGGKVMGARFRHTRINSQRRSYFFHDFTNCFFILPLHCLK